MTASALTLPKLTQDAIAHLTRITLDYVATGVAVMDVHYNDSPILGITHLRGYFGELAKSMGRPFVHATRHTYKGRQGAEDPVTNWSLSVPHHKRMQPVTAGLFLVSEERKGYETYNTSVPVHHKIADSRITFMFSPGTGDELLMALIEQCRTDPLIRHALKV